MHAQSHCKARGGARVVVALEEPRLPVEVDRKQHGRLHSIDEGRASVLARESVWRCEV